MHITFLVPVCHLQFLVQSILPLHGKLGAVRTGVCVVHLGAFSAWPWDIVDAQLLCDGLF